MHEKKIMIKPKKQQINNFNNEQIERILKDINNEWLNITSISIQGNSYSLDFCKNFSEIFLSQSTNLQVDISIQKSLDINDIFVSRSKQEIPASIQHISKALIHTNLIKLDISHNAVNPFGAKALLGFLSQASFLQVLLISNCGLGPLGVKQIATGLEGTPNLKVLSIARNRMENQGVISLSDKMKFVPKLEELFVYQNTLRKEGLSKLFNELRINCKMLNSFDFCDNFVREEASQQLFQLIVENIELKNINLSDCLTEQQNQKIVSAFEITTNREFVRLGFNYIELQEELALRLLAVLKQCPLAKLEITGNDFPKKVKEAYLVAFPKKGVLSKFDENEDEEDEELTRLFEEMKI